MSIVVYSRSHHITHTHRATTILTNGVVQSGGSIITPDAHKFLNDSWMRWPALQLLAQQGIRLLVQKIDVAVIERLLELPCSVLRLQTFITHQPAQTTKTFDNVSKTY